MKRSGEEEEWDGTVFSYYLAPEVALWRTTAAPVGGSTSSTAVVRTSSRALQARLFLCCANCRPRMLDSSFYSGGLCLTQGWQGPWLLVSTQPIRYFSWTLVDCRLLNLRVELLYSTTMSRWVDLITCWNNIIIMLVTMLAFLYHTPGQYEY